MAIIERIDLGCARNLVLVLIRLTAAFRIISEQNLRVLERMEYI
jgi:hypothetical protein